MSILYTDLLAHEITHELEPWHWIVHTVELVESQLSSVKRCMLRLVNKDSGRKKYVYLAESRHGPEIVNTFCVYELCCVEQCIALFGKAEKLSGHMFDDLTKLANRNKHIVILEWLLGYWKIGREKLDTATIRYMMKCAKEGKLEFLEQLEHIYAPSHGWAFPVIAAVIEGKADVTDKVAYIRKVTRNKLMDAAGRSDLWKTLIETGNVDVLNKLLNPNSEDGIHSMQVAEHMHDPPYAHRFPGSIEMYNWMRYNYLEISYDERSLRLAASRKDAKLVEVLFEDITKRQIMNWEKKNNIYRCMLHWAMHYGNSEIVELLIDKYPQQVWHGQEFYFVQIVTSGYHSLASKLLRGGLVPAEHRKEIRHTSMSRFISRDNEKDFIAMVDVLAEHGVKFSIGIAMDAYEIECDELIKHLWNNHRDTQNWPCTDHKIERRSRRFKESMDKMDDSYTTNRGFICAKC